jgi:hypothetical protein
MAFVFVDAPALQGALSGEELARQQHALDVSLSLDGVRNSLLLREYMGAYPHLRVAARLLKLWGRHVSVLNARRGWLSPYAVTIMLVHYLAAAGEGATPGGNAPFPLPREAAVALLDVGTVEPMVKGLVERPALPQLADPLLGGAEDANIHSPIGQAAVALAVECVQGFFDYYANVFDFDEDVVDVRATSDRVTSKAQWFTAEEDAAMTDEAKWHRIGYGVLMIRDPYEHHSLGRSVEFFRAEAIRERFREMAAHDGEQVDAFLAAVQTFVPTPK